jgi:integrase/recombinase XerD
MSNLVSAFEEYLTIIKSLAPNSVKAYIADILDLETFLEKQNKELLDINNDLLISYLQEIENPLTQNRHLSSINSFFNFASENFDDIVKPKVSFSKLPQTLPKYLSEQQIHAGLALIDRTNILGKRDYAIALFLYATGVRVSELIQVKKSDIEKNWIRVLYAKGSKQRLVPIAQVALSALYEYLNERTISSDYLFLNYQGKPISRISIFKITQKYFGVSPHVFRHSYATSLILGGADLMVVSELLGHSNIETTQIYTHIQQKHLTQTIDDFHPLNNRKVS